MTFTPEGYGASIADIYDSWYTSLLPTDETVESIHALAAGGSVLELGVGTGRIAVPLARLGLQVAGVDISPQMLAQLKVEADGLEIQLLHGDMATASLLPQRFNVVYAAFNSFFALTSLRQQARCVQNAARHLKPGGVFVLEAKPPTAAAVAQGRACGVARLSSDSVLIETCIFDEVAQTVDSQLVHLSDVGVRLYPASTRHASLSEIDLMAELAGLEFAARWRDWKGQPYRSASDNHIACYRMPACVPSEANEEELP